MANSVKYNTSAESLALNTGYFWIGTGDVAKGPTSVNGFYSAINPSNIDNDFADGYTIYQNKASQGPSIMVAADDAELITITNKIAGTSYNTVNECFLYFAGEDDKFILNLYVNPIITDGLVLNLSANIVPSYPKSEDTWYDLSGNGNTTSCTNYDYNGKYFFSVGDAPGVLKFSTPDSTTIANTFSVTSGGWVIEELIRIDDTTYPESAAGTVVSTKAYSSTATGFDWQHGTTNLSYLNIDMSNMNTGGGDMRDAEVNIAVDTEFQNYNRWFLRSIYWNREDDTCGVYYNGKFQGSGSITGVSGYSLYDGGGISWGTLYGWQHDGARSSMRVYNRILSQQEINHNYYQAPIVTDDLILALDAGNLVSYDPDATTTYSLVGTDTGTLTGGVVFNGGNGGVWGFDGDNDYINIPYGEQILNNIGVTSGIDNDVAYSMEAWVLLNGYPAGVGGSGYGIMGHNSSLGIGLQAFGNNSDRVWFNFGYRTNNNFDSSDVSLNQWYHVVATREVGGDCIIYINGEADTLSSNKNAVDFTTADFGIGESPSRIGNFNGNVAVTRIYDRVLTAGEVAQNYGAEKGRFSNVSIAP